MLALASLASSARCSGQAGTPAQDADTYSVAKPTAREIVVTREFHAPRSRVFDALTKPELIKQWFEPEGWSLIACDVDLKAGGAFRFVWRRPRGEMTMRGIYREVARPARLVHTEEYDISPFQLLVTVVLVEQHGRTRLMSTSLYPSEKARDADYPSVA
ncbi:MAG: SRPBCC domain-containing protein, partial [Candidatus Acidiferrales bacterium]